MASGSGRVIFVDHVGAHGGGQLGLYRLLRRCRESDIPIEVVFFQGGTIADKIERLDVPIVVAYPEGPRRNVISTAWWLWRRLSHRKDALLVANSLRAALVLGLTPIPRRRLVCYVREDVSRKSVGRLKSAVVGWILLPRYGTLIANSESTRSSFAGPRSSRTRATVAYPVSGIHDLSAEDAHTEIDAKRSSTSFRVISLSRLQWWKGIDLLIDAIAIANKLQARPVDLTIAGGGPMSDPAYELELRKRAAEQGISVEFVGHVDDVESLLQSAHLLCVCSRTPEAFGQVIPQAMVNGVPVIAPRAGGPREVVQATGGGVLVPPDDVMSLARAIATLASDTDEWTRLAASGLEGSKLFSDESTARSMFDTLRAAMRKANVLD